MRVACLHIRDFLVALARRDDPSLAQRPIVIGGSPDEHSAVIACSPEAAATGVTVGMTLRRALALCHDAVFLPHQEATATAEADGLVELLGRYSPLVEAIAPGHVHFEVRGLAQMAGMEEDDFFHDLYSTVCAETGLPVSLAGAETVFAAHAVAISIRDSRFAIHDSDVLALVPQGQDRAYLAQLPIEVLPVSPFMHQRLRLLGLERLGQVAELSFSAMQAQFGPEGAHAWELANGKDDSLIVPGRDELRINEEMELPAPTALSEPIVVATRVLLQRGLNHPEVRGQSLRRLDWRLGLESGEQISRKFVFREPTNDILRMLFVARNRIDRLQLASAAVSVSVTLSGICSEYGHQANLWPVGPRRQKELVEAVEQLNERAGGPQVFRIVEVQPWSRIPERQLGLVAFGP